MRCPFCSYKATQVVETRETGEDITRRRRECLKCRRRFTTYEKQESFNIRVIKKDGNRELFDREKVKKGILKACEKRPITLEQIDKAVEAIEKNLKDKRLPEIKSSVIGDLVMKYLKKLDSVAYIRFASVYRAFHDIGEFEKEVRLLKNKDSNKHSKDNSCENDNKNDNKNGNNRNNKSSKAKSSKKNSTKKNKRS